MGRDESASEEVGCGWNGDVEIDEWSLKAGENKQQKWEKKEFKMVMRADEEHVGKRVIVDGLLEGKEDGRGGRWTASRMTWGRKDCRGRRSVSRFEFAAIRACD